MRTDEARMKWCPMMRVRDPWEDCACLTTACVAWVQESKDEGHCELINFPPVQVLTSPD